MELRTFAAAVIGFLVLGTAVSPTYAGFNQPGAPAPQATTPVPAVKPPAPSVPASATPVSATAAKALPSTAAAAPKTTVPYSRTTTFRAFLRDLKAQAAAKGISQAVINRALPDTMTPNAHILELDHEQPEGGASLAQYLHNVVTPDRVSKGRDEAARYSRLLSSVESTYHVDRGPIVALWGIETSYGENTGGYDVVAALATLAYDGRRGDFFRDELFLALKILQEGDVRQGQMKGSWAGAMGQNQFMPSSFFKFAVDFDKDGRKDIWNSHPDIFASTANYLALSGWKKGMPWGRKVQLPAGFERRLLGADNTYTLKYLQDKGVRQMNGKPLSFEGEYMGAVIQPDGAGTQAYVVYENYRVFMRWNKSTYFAIAAGLLSDKVQG